MPVLVNPNTTFAENFDDPQAAQQALQTGYHVPLMDQEGNSVALPYDEAQKAIQAGTHVQPNSNQLADLIKTAKHSSALEQGKTFIEGAANALTFGGYSAAGISDPHEQLAREEVNPGWNTLGEIAGTGIGLGLMPEASAPGIIAKAGEALAGGIKAEGLFGKATQLAVRGALEGGLYGASHELSENLLGNPNQTAENMAANIGLSAVLGGGLSLALAPLAHGVTSFLEKGAAVKEGLSELKPNASEVREAANTIGAPLLDSQLSDSKFIQDLDSTLMKSPTIPGIERQQLANQGFKAAGKAVDDALGQDLGLTKAQVGDEIKKGLSDKFEAEYKPINELYSKIKEMGAQVPVDEDSIQKLSSSVTKIDGLLSSKGAPLSENSPSWKLATQVADEVKNLGTVDDVRQYAQRIGQDTIGKPELKYTAGQIKGMLNDLQESSVSKFANNITDSGLKAQAQDLLKQQAEAKLQYAGLREKMGDIGSIVGKKLRKGEGPQAFLDWLNDTAPEKIADKLFTKNNSGFLNFMRESFPQEADMLASLKKGQLRDAAMENGRIVPSKVLKQVDKLEPEIKGFLFKPDDLKKIEAAGTWIESFPKNVNPSETSKGIQLFDAFKNPISTVASHVADWVKRAIIKGAVTPAEGAHINALAHMVQFTGKSAKLIERYASGIFGAQAAKAITALPPKRADVEMTHGNEPVKMNKIAGVIMAHNSDPLGLAEHLDNNTRNLNQYAPNTISAFHQTVGAGVSFLASKLPSLDKQSPLDATRTPSNDEIAKFNRYASIVENPFEVLNRVKTGDLLPQDIETLSTVFPTLYDKMKNTLTEKLTEHMTKKEASDIPYKTRLGMSMFLGENLDSTISPQGIMSNQNVLTQMAAQKQANAMQQMKPSKSGMGKMKSFMNDATSSQQSAMRRTKGT